MSKERQIDMQDYPKYSNEWFVWLYLKYGSAEKVLQQFWRGGEALPISIAQYHRLISKTGIVKSVGRKQTSISESIYFFAHKALEPAYPLAKVYRELMPLDFETSLVSLHRVYNSVIRGQTPKHATALLINPGDHGKILIAREQTSSVRYAKFRGDATVPMSYSRSNEDPKLSILRVLQQEVWQHEAVTGQLSITSDLVREIIPDDPIPLAFVDVLDVRLSVYALSLPSFFPKAFSSSRVSNHKFINMDQADNTQFRFGVREMVDYYKQTLFGHTASQVPVFSSDLNYLLARG